MIAKNKHNLFVQGGPEDLQMTFRLLAAPTKLCTRGLQAVLVDGMLGSTVRKGHLLVVQRHVDLGLLQAHDSKHSQSYQGWLQWTACDDGDPICG